VCAKGKGIIRSIRVESGEKVVKVQKKFMTRFCTEKVIQLITLGLSILTRKNHCFTSIALDLNGGKRCTHIK
jgi:hypothetical protein